MANIMITNVCNLSCSYCFANEYVNRDGIQHIKPEVFEQALHFALTAKKEEHIGLIGGEPTLHPKFGQILQIINEKEQVKEAILFTNGLRIDDYLEELKNEKIHLLINVNNPEVIGRVSFEKIRSNIKRCLTENGMEHRITLGLNIYDPELSYDYIFEFLDEFPLKELRLSIIVPNEHPEDSFDALAYFKKMKPAALSVIKRCLQKGITPYYDCNKLPLCLLSAEEREELYRLFGSMPISNILSEKVNCSPVIDILQDLTAVRCFGLSDYMNVDIRDFSSIDDLRGFFENEIDIHAHSTLHHPECINCYERRCKKCSGGCLAYKIDRIYEVSTYAETLFEKENY